MREIKYRYAPDFPGILQELRASLLVSTYQAGKLVVLGASDGKLRLSLHNFEQAMGVAVHPRRIAIGTKTQVWFLSSAPDIAPRIEPPGHHDAAYLTRTSHFTGEVHGHEMAWSNEELWLVNTRFSCLCTLSSDYNFVPRWRPPFISQIAPQDRCHLNGMALADGQPKYATAMAESDEPSGWRPTKATSGCVLDIATGEAIVRGLCMPHSPRVHGGHAWLLNSGQGTLDLLEPEKGELRTVAAMPGYTRGLAFAGRFAFIGLSKIRETSTFGGVPIAEHRNELRCGVGVVDLTTGRQVAHFEFEAGVDEIFDVQVLPGCRFPAISGPHAATDGGQPIWLVPEQNFGKG